MADGQLRIRNILVVGAGIAGLACAVACARSGAQVQVMEARAIVGGTAAHLDVVPNLLRDLARIGVGQDCARRGFAYSGLAVVDEDGAPCFELSTPRLAGDRLPAAVGIAYDEMLEVLATHAVNAGVRIIWGSPVDAVDLHSGRALFGAGQRVEADLIVLATGMGSRLVESIFGRADHSATQTWWHALLPRPAGLDRATWMAGGPGRRLLLVPISMSRAGLAVVGAPAAGRENSASVLAETLAAWGGLPRRLSSLIEPDSPTTLHVSGGAVLPGLWHRGAVVCAGAAAHAVARPFGQSAAQALEDATVLGELVAAGLARADLMEQYMARRGERARRVHALTEQAVRWMSRLEPDTDLMALAKELGDLVAEPA